MKIKNRSKDLVVIAGLTIAPGRTGIIGERAYREWLGKSCRHAVIASKTVIIPPTMDPLIGLMDAIKRGEHPGIAYTKDGYPTCRSLQAILGRRVTVAERDSAWHGPWMTDLSAGYDVAA